MLSAPNSCQVKLQKNKSVNNTKEEVKPLNKNFPNVNNITRASQQQVKYTPTTRKKPNLVPRNYRQSFFIMLSNQVKWNLVIEKLIDAFDRSEASAQNETTE